MLAHNLIMHLTAVTSIAMNLSVNKTDHMSHLMTILMTDLMTDPTTIFMFDTTIN